MTNKECIECHRTDQPWYSKKRCKRCSQKSYAAKSIDKPKIAINRVSEKRKQEQKSYSVLRKLFLDNHNECEAKLHGCTGNSTDIHHTFSGKDRSSYYLDIKTWKSVCRNCHIWIHDNPKLARELKLLK